MTINIYSIYKYQHEAQKQKEKLPKHTSIIEICDKILLINQFPS